MSEIARGRFLRAERDQNPNY